ncbi:MAG: fructosamine kinase family protein [Verrucomicrobiota bacterium]
MLVDPALQSHLLARFQENTGQALSSPEVRSVSGGCIHQSFLLRSPEGAFFAKINSASCAPLLQAESEGLRHLATTKEIRVPRVLSQGTHGEQAFLLLEALDLVPLRAGQASLGRKLAALHAHQAARHGFPQDNFIGATAQRNALEENWADFFTQHRIEFQIHLAEKHGYRLADSPRAVDRFHQLLSSHQPAPSLLHGDLWGGNAAELASSQEPVLFDPAVFYGDRETDLAFTRLFGGFEARFYAAYQEASPLPPGWQERSVLYNLYHQLNHLNLFGESYLPAVSQILARLAQASSLPS